MTGTSCKCFLSCSLVNGMEFLGVSAKIVEDRLVVSRERLREIGLCIDGTRGLISLVLRVKSMIDNRSQSFAK